MHCEKECANNVKMLNTTSEQLGKKHHEDVVEAIDTYIATPTLKNLKLALDEIHKQ
jgi:hypothetical protein